MIRVGLAGWGDHEKLYTAGVAPRDRLRVYSAHFPIVEVDSSFYAIQSEKNWDKWIEETPAGFLFIPKAYQGMTGHERGKISRERLDRMFDDFKRSIVPPRKAGKLKAVLFQYPPWFDCTKKNVDLLRYTKEKMEDIPVAVEFRNRSWFTPQMTDRTLAFLEKEGWIHCICDEPQAGEGSVPIVLHATHPELTLVRFHGRNAAGWVEKGPNSRAVRCLYRYSREELLEWKGRLEQLLKATQEICVLFNNNSGGDAAPNAKEMMQLLGIEYRGEVPGQLELF
jgi:uncharacterized protein YecE (DUF72 family)